MGCSHPGSSVHGILQARILEWVAISFSRGSFQPRDWTQVSWIAGRFFDIWATREALANNKDSIKSSELKSCEYLIIPWLSVFQDFSAHSACVFNIIFMKTCYLMLEKAMAPHFSTIAWKIPWAEEPGRLQSMRSLTVGHDWATSLSLFTFMHWRRMATHSSVLAWRIPGMGEPGGLPSVGSHRVGHDWSDLAAAAAAAAIWCYRQTLIWKFRLDVEEGMKTWYLKYLSVSLRCQQGREKQAVKNISPHPT